MARILITAPPPLVAWYQEKTILKGRDILERLLTEPAMNDAWKKLRKKITSDRGWERFFIEIVVLSRQAKKRLPSRQAKRDGLLTIACRARKLADSIAEGPLDRLAYEFFSPDNMSDIGVPDWLARDAMQRSSVAHGLLPVWPSAIDLLHELESQATHLAAKAMSESRVVQRSGAKSAELYFARALAEYCRLELGSPMYGQVADIENIGLGYKVTADFVKKAARRGGTLRPPKHPP